MAVLQAQTALCSRGRRPFLPLTAAAGMTGARAAASTRPLRHSLGRQQVHSHPRQMIKGQQRASLVTARFATGDEALVLSRNPYYREIPWAGA
jgi:hypothetical protein